MCGISGAYTSHLNDEHTKLVNAVMLSQTARGPDHQALTQINGKQAQLILAHNRLSIIDLSEQANQPMWDASHRYCIVYNGEVYNYLELRAELLAAAYVFNNASDTEVILNAFAHWGVAALERLQGPFAFALFDSQTEQLWLCRDRFGIRPLYYIEVNNVLYFASTSAMLARKLNLKPDLAYLAKGLQYLVYEDGSEMTAYQGLLSLPAGSYLQAAMNNKLQLVTAVSSYYDLYTNVQNKIESFPLHDTESFLDQIHHRLEYAVNIRLRTDVPLAISLSGGLDSSSVAALVSKQHSNTIGFSFSHPDFRKSEGPLVAKCADYLNIKIEYVWPSQTEMIEALHKTIEVQDAPFSSLSIVAQYLLYKKVRSSGIKVLLGGQGGDEAFMGYKKYLLFQLRNHLKQKRYLKTASQLLQLTPMILSEMSALKSYWGHRHRYLNHNKTEFSALRLPTSPQINLQQTDDDLWKRQLFDITKYSLPTLLRYEDRNAMGNSVESRLPYMDHQLVELGLALPEALKLRAGYGKWGIRKIMQDKIPDEIRLARYKRGFDIPFAPLMQAGLGKSIRDTLLANPAINHEFLKQPQKISETFSDQALAQRKNALSEAISLLWLNKVMT